MLGRIHLHVKSRTRDDWEIGKTVKPAGDLSRKEERAATVLRP
jgi:hypothetical protein